MHPIILKFKLIHPKILSYNILHANALLKRRELIQRQAMQMQPLGILPVAARDGGLEPPVIHRHTIPFD